MANKSTSVYKSLSLTALLGLVACFYVRSEMMSLVNCICFAYVPVMYVFFRMGLDDVIEKPLLCVSSWFALIAVEIAILIGIGFWWLPLFAVLVPAMYFLIRAWLFKKDLSIKDLYRNVFAIVFLTYALFAVIKLLIAPLFVKLLT